MDENTRNEILNKIKKQWPEKSVNSAMKNLEEILKYPHLLSVFRLDSNEQANDIDVAILRSLLKAKQKNFKAQMELALTWNRIDIARNFIFTNQEPTVIILNIESQGLKIFFIIFIKIRIIQ